eukprot:15485052-Alexandrium_andersonii.AAC.1
MPTRGWGPTHRPQADQPRTQGPPRAPRPTGAARRRSTHRLAHPTAGLRRRPTGCRGCRSTCAPGPTRS